MNKEKIIEVLYIIVAIILGIVAVKIALWLLPLILIAVFSYFFYTKIRKNNPKGRNNNKNTPKRPMKVIHDDEKDNK